MLFEKHVFFTQEQISIRVGRILAEDSLTTISTFHTVFAPKEYTSFLKKYEQSFEINQEDIFYDQDDFLYNKNFLIISVKKQINANSYEVDVSLKPFEYVFNYEVFTRIKYFMNPQPRAKFSKDEDRYNSFTKFNDFLSESKDKAEEFIKEKIKSLLGHSLDLQLNFLSTDSCFIIPDSVTREQTPLLLLSFYFLIN